MSRYQNPTPQFLDDAGDPLIAGKLYFYETGTLTAKNTYADSGLSIANTNPVLLDGSGRTPNIFFDGVAKVILTDSDEVQEWVRDPVGGSAASESQWSSWVSSTTYSLNDIVQASDGNYYFSKVSNNVGNEPSISAAEWDQTYVDGDARYLQISAATFLPLAGGTLTGTVDYNNETSTTPLQRFVDTPNDTIGALHVDSELLKFTRFYQGGPSSPTMAYFDLSDGRMYAISTGALSPILTQTDEADITPGLAKARVSFDGTTTGPVTIFDSDNVTSVVDDSIGLYTVNLTNDMDSVNYVVEATAEIDISGNAVTANISGTPKTASAFQILTQLGRATSDAVDSPQVDVAVFGDLA